MSKHKKTTYFSPKLRWLRLFLKDVEYLLPPDKSILKVYHTPFSSKNLHRSWGQCSTSNDLDYIISLRTDLWELSKWGKKPRDKKRMSCEFSKIEVLANFAHEISHIVSDWDHTPRRQILENEILTVFMLRLIRQGYTSEEKEVD